MKRLNVQTKKITGKLTAQAGNYLTGLANRLRNFKVDRNSLTFLIFLGLSMFFWFLQALNKEYETTLKFPVKYNNPPKGYIIENPLPEYMQLRVSDEGFGILRYKLTNAFFPVNLNVESILKRSVMHDGRGHSVVLARELTDEISRQLNSGTKLQFVTPDTLHFYYAQLLSKRIPVRGSMDILPARQHIVSGPILIQPDSVTVFGPGSLIDTIRQVYTEAEKFHGIEDTLIRNINLKALPGVEMDENRVVVQIPVETFTEKKLSIPVTGSAFPDSLQLRTFPGLVEVSFIVALSHYNIVHPDDLKAFIYYSDVMNQAKGTAKVHLQINQPWIQNARLKQNELEYLVEYSKNDL